MNKKTGYSTLLLAVGIAVYSSLIYYHGQKEGRREVTVQIESLQKTFYNNANETYRMAPGNGALHDFADNLGGLLQVLEAKQEGRLPTSELHDLERQIFSQDSHRKTLNASGFPDPYRGTLPQP